MRVDRRLIVPLFVAVAMGVYFLLSPRVPREQSVEIVLGSAASRVGEVRLAYDDPAHDWSSEVEFNFSGKPTPRVVHHEARMPDGDYTLSIDVSGSGRSTHVERKIALRGGTTSVDVQEVVVAALDATGGAGR